MNLLITGAWNQANEYFAEIEKMGHQISFLQNEQDALPCAYEWVEGIIGNGVFLYHPARQFTKLKYVQLTSVGFDRIPMEYMEEQSIIVHNAKGVYDIPMAEYAVAGVLSLYRQDHFFRIRQKEHVWEKNRDLRELSGRTVCVFGCGSVGCECAKRFKAFGCTVVGIDRRSRNLEYFDKVYPADKMKEILSVADIVMITLPLNRDTFHIINKEVLQYIKRNAVVVNISRGAIIDTEAFIESLNTGLFGAVLDVFEEEPLRDDSPLWDMKNVIITPHNSFVGDGSNGRLSNLIIKNLKNLESK